MTRVKRGTIAAKKRKKILKYTKGFRWGRKSKERAAKEALLHAWTHAFRGRKEKKRDLRTLWQVKINAAARKNGVTYSRFINALMRANVGLDRKILADLAENYPKVFKVIVEKVKR
ncbi:MAG: 50S ribosomal protein L20 [Candidatus Liptonbacteria bacterium]|nr:50S ribosomal protein L20 [Candidatus Liptonbacteria bacterium]